MDGSNSTLRSRRGGVNGNLQTPLKSPHKPFERWRCKKCGRTLAFRLGPFLEITLGKRHLYRVSTPASANCPHCRALNELP